MGRATIDQRMAKYIRIDESTGCHLWTGNVNRGGYGRVHVNGRKHVVHRIAYEIANGPIPEGMDIDHLCRTRSCCNPVHLEAVSRSTNLRRGIGAGSMREDGSFLCRVCGSSDYYEYSRKSCVGGVGRRCRPCNAARWSRYHAENKGTINARKRIARAKGGRTK